jgi:hypothetical protein
MDDVGIVFASTGGNKMVRTLRSFQKMEPDTPVHIVFDVSSHSWQIDKNNPPKEWFEQQPGVEVIYLVQNNAHINGALNAGIGWMEHLGFKYAALFHDDLVFSPLAEHQRSISNWWRCTEPLLRISSGFRFTHFETFVPEEDSRRKPEDWDKEDLESEELWQYLKGHSMVDGREIRPPGRSFWFKYEGPDVVRKWNRLGPTGQVVPIKTWRWVGRFDEKEGIFYDGEYPSECFRRGLPPVYAVTNFPYIHLHNQTMNPWRDPAPGVWGDTMAAYVKRFGADWAGFWKDDWEAKWE